MCVYLKRAWRACEWRGIKHEGIIGIRGMRQLDLDRSFSVFEAVCWPGMSVSISFSVRHRQDQVIPCATSKRLPRPGFGSSQRDFPAEERVYRRRTEENVRVAGACVALGRAISCKGKPSILVSGEQLEGAQRKRRMWDCDR